MVKITLELSLGTPLAYLDIHGHLVHNPKLGEALEIKALFVLAHSSTLKTHAQVQAALQAALTASGSSK